MAGPLGAAPAHGSCVTAGRLLTLAAKARACRVTPAVLPPHLTTSQQVTVPGATDKGAMKLVDVLGRLLLLALRKAGSPSRFCVAAGAVASLAGANSLAGLVEGWPPATRPTGCTDCSCIVV